MGLVLERLTERPLPQLLRERVLAPLGMNRSRASITDDLRRDLAVGYRRLFDDRPPQRHHPLVPAPWATSDTADGSVVSTAPELCAYLRVLLRRGRGPAGPLLSEAGFQRMVAPVVEMLPDDPGCFYGYGLWTRVVEGHRLLAHSGGMVGFTALMAGDLDAGVGAVLLLNGWGEREAVVAYALAALRAWREGREPPEAPPPSDPSRVPGAAAYAGVYRAGDRVLVVAAEGERLVLVRDGERVALERRGRDAFAVAAPDLEAYLLRLERQGDRVVACAHGPDW